MSQQSHPLVVHPARSCFGRAALTAVATLITIAATAAIASPAGVIAVACIGGAATLWFLQEGLIRLSGTPLTTTEQDRPAQLPARR